MSTYTITITEERRRDYEGALLLAASKFEKDGDSANCNYYRGLAYELMRGRVTPNEKPSAADPMLALGKRYQMASAVVVFVCTEYREREGYRMVPEVNICPERWVSPRAIDRTFLETHI